MVASNLNLNRPSRFWHVEGLLSVYVTILAFLAAYSFLTKDYWVGFFLVSNTALVFVAALSLLTSARHAWDATLTIAIAEPIFAGWLLPLHLSALLVFTFVSMLALSPLIILTLTDWDLEAFFGKEFVYTPVVELRSFR